MRTPFVRFLATFAFSVAAAWSTVTGALDVRFSMALVVSAGLFWGRGALIAGLVGLGAPIYCWEPRPNILSLTVESDHYSQ